MLTMHAGQNDFTIETLLSVRITAAGQVNFNTASGHMGWLNKDVKYEIWNNGTMIREGVATEPPEMPAPRDPEEAIHRIINEGKVTSGDEAIEAAKERWPQLFNEETVQ